MQPLYIVIGEDPQEDTHTPPIGKPHHKSRIKHPLGEGFEVSPERGKRHKRWASNFQKMLSTPWPVRVCFPLQSVSNYCGTLGIWIHLQWIPLRLLPDIWDQSGLRRWCACCGNVDRLTDAGFWCHGISESLWLEPGRRRRRGRREIEAEIEEGEGRGRDRGGREGGKREILLDCPLAFKHFIGFGESEEEEEEWGERKDGSERGSERAPSLPNSRAAGGVWTVSPVSEERALRLAARVPRPARPSATPAPEHLSALGRRLRCGRPLRL